MPSLMGLIAIQMPDNHPVVVNKFSLFSFQDSNPCIRFIDFLKGYGYAGTRNEKFIVACLNDDGASWYPVFIPGLF